MQHDKDVFEIKMAALLYDDARIAVLCAGQDAACPDSHWSLTSPSRDTHLKPELGKSKSQCSTKLRLTLFSPFIFKNGCSI